MTVRQRPKLIGCKRLAHRVDIMADSTGAGQEVPKYTKIIEKSVQCMVMDTGGSEYFRGRQVSADVSQVVVMRYRDTIKPYHVLKFNGRILNINRIIDRDNAKDWLEIDCSENVT